jgi:hypothetical protein
MLHERKRDERCNGRKIYTRARRSDAAENAAATCSAERPGTTWHVARCATCCVARLHATRRSVARRSGACRSFISRTCEGLVMCSTSALWVCTSERAARLRYRACCLLPGVWCLFGCMVSVRCLLYVACCLLYGVCRMRSVANCTAHVACCRLPLPCRASLAVSCTVSLACCTCTLERMTWLKSCPRSPSSRPCGRT